MRMLSIALLCASMSTSAFANWETVWKKTQEGDSPASIMHVLNHVNGAYDFIVNYELKRRIAGLPSGTLKNLSHTITMDKWVGTKSTCTIDDPRQYEAIESGSFSWSTGENLIFANNHEYMGEDWNPCEDDIAAEKRRMLEPKPLNFTALKTR